MKINRVLARIIFTMMIAFASLHIGNAQKLHLGLFTDPLVGWYSSDAELISGGGVRAGFSTGLAVNYYFSRNYAFSTGLNYTRTGGVQSSAEPTTFLFSNFSTEVAPGEKAIYSASYINMPVGIRLRTNQIGYFSVFSDLGLDPGFLNRGTITIPSADIEDELASKELKKLNLGFHIQAGAEYSLGGSTTLIIGIGYDHGLTDVTKDNTGQPSDKTSSRIIRFRLGLFF
jgi:hypothetical protein